MVRNVADVYQSEQYSMAAQKVKRAQGALNILSNSVRTGGTDKAVMIHPKAQERMENDPEFAKEVMERIESWWAYDIARNEAISPGCTTGMSQAIAIGEDGEIANVLAGGGSNTMRSNKQKNNNDEDEYDWWTERMARHALYMQLWLEGKSDINLSSFSFMGGGSFGSSGFSSMNSMLAMQSGQSAEREIHSMLQNGLKEKLGDTICGMPTDEVIQQTFTDIDRCRAIRSTMASQHFTTE